MTKREELINKLTFDFKDTIVENVYDMSNKELKMANHIYGLLKIYKELNIELPKDKKYISSIKDSFYFNLKQCYDYIFYPSNKAPYLMLRIVFENLIILKFLLENDNDYCTNWYYWEILTLLNSYKNISNIGINMDILETICPDFYIWKNNTISNISEKYGKDRLKTIINNKYGWAYSKKMKTITLSSIAKECKADLAYEGFKINSSTVHSNTYNLQLNLSRFDHHTFDISRGILNALTLISTYLYDYIAKDSINNNFLTLLESATNYQENYSKNYFKFLVKENQKYIQEYVDTIQDD